MLTQVIAQGLRSAGLRPLTALLRRNIGLSAAAYQKVDMDPIQKAFVEKIHAYAQKSKAAGGKLVDATPEVNKQMQDELTRIEKMYNATGKDMTKFPEFTFTDPDLEKVDLGLSKEELTAQIEAKEKQSAGAAAEDEGKVDENLAYFEKF